MKIMRIGILAATMIAASMSMASAADFTLCGGSKGGVYDYTALQLQSQVDKSIVNVVPVNTTGSGENLKAIADGSCDGAIVQSDAIFVYTKDNGPISYVDLGPLYTEFVHLVCRRASNVTNLSDLTANTKVMIGKDGSGSNITYRGLVFADKTDGGDAYSKIPVLNEGGDTASLVKLKGGNAGATCMIAVSAPGGKFLSNDVEKFSADLIVTPLYDKDFNDVTITDVNGQSSSVWTPVELAGSTYKKIMPSGVFTNKSVDTIGVNARLIVSEKWMNENPDAFGEVGLKLIDAIKIVKADKKVDLLVQ